MQLEHITHKTKISTSINTMTVAYPTKTITLQRAYTVCIAVIKQSLISQPILNSLTTVIVIATTIFIMLQSL